MNAVLISALVLLPSVALANPDWDKPSEPFRVAGNIYSVGTKGIGVYLITTPEGHILLDGATEKGAAVVEDNIRALGFGLSDVKYIIESHAHFDHVGGLAQIKADTGASFVASQADRKALESGSHDGDNANGVGRFPPVKVDRVIGDGEVLTLGGIMLTAHLTPGHTKGCTSWSTDTTDAGKTYSVLFFCSTTTAGNFLVGNEKHPDIVADYRKSFARLKTLKIDILLANHPEFVGLNEKRVAQKAGRAEAFVDPQALPKLVAAQEKAFETELKRQEKTQ